MTGGEAAVTSERPTPAVVEWVASTACESSASARLGTCTPSNLVHARSTRFVAGNAARAEKQKSIMAQCHAKGLEGLTIQCHKWCCLPYSARVYTLPSTRRPQSLGFVHEHRVSQDYLFFTRSVAAIPVSSSRPSPSTGARLPGRVGSKATMGERGTGPCTDCKIQPDQIVAQMDSIRLHVHDRRPRYLHRWQALHASKQRHAVQEKKPPLAVTHCALLRLGLDVPRGGTSAR